MQNRQNNYSRCIGSMLNETTSCVTSSTFHASQFHRRCRINYDPTLVVTHSRPSVANYNYIRPCRGSRLTISSVLQTRVQLSVPSWRALKEIWLFFVAYFFFNLSCFASGFDVRALVTTHTASINTMLCNLTTLLNLSNVYEHPRGLSISVNRGKFSAE